MSVIAFRSGERRPDSPSRRLPAEPTDVLLDRAALLAGIGAWSCELADEQLSWTAGVYRIFGLPEGARLDRRELVGFYAPQSREKLERVRSAALARAEPFSLEAEIVRPDGDRRWIRITADIVRENGRAVRLYGLKQDISEERKRWEALRRQAERDPLTGLANRSVFQLSFLDSPARQDPRQGAALLLLDVDGFKQINDTHGHAAGDACLETIGRRLTLGLVDASLIARIGGDEFAALLPTRKRDPIELEAAAARLLASLATPILWRGHRLSLSASAGIALPDAFDHDPEHMFAAADAALYAAKRAGKNRLCVAPGGERRLSVRQ
jgi:diguanylate cyclase (GGDEF)-like protein/PAS domain S-box-containing protein